MDPGVHLYGEAVMEVCMVPSSMISPSYIYACTRFRVRKTTLLPREEYLRIMQMSIPEIITHLGRQEDYRQDIVSLAHEFTGAQLIEEAVNQNLSRSFHHATAIAPGDLQTLTREYLARWDIANVMAILRGTVHNVDRQQIRDLLIPAGEIDDAHLNHLLSPLHPVARLLMGLEAGGSTRSLQSNTGPAERKVSLPSLRMNSTANTIPNCSISAHPGAVGARK
mgnify:CR=1 FL=1